MNEKLTAYALNELPPDERGALEEQLKNDPALQKQADEIKAFCALLEHEVSQEAGAFKPGQRAQLVQSFQNTRRISRPLWRRPAFLGSIGLAAAACLAVMIAIQQVKPKAEMTVAPAPIVTAMGLPQDEIAAMKDSDESRAREVAVKAAATEKKEIAKSPLPATPRPATVDALIAVNAPPMPASPAEPQSVTALGRADATLSIGAVIQVPRRSLPATPPAAGLSQPAQDSLALRDGVNARESIVNRLPAASTYAGIAPRGELFSNSNLQAPGLVVNGGSLASQRQTAANLASESPGNPASGLDLNGFVAATTNLGNSGMAAAAQTPQNFGDGIKSNAIGAGGGGTVNELLVQHNQAGSSQRNLISGMPNGGMAGAVGPRTESPVSQIANGGFTVTDGAEFKPGNLMMNGATVSNDGRQVHLEEAIANGSISGNATMGPSGTSGVVTGGNSSTADDGIRPANQMVPAGTGTLMKSGAGTLILGASTIFGGGGSQVQQSMQESRPMIAGTASDPNLAVPGDKKTSAPGALGGWATVPDSSALAANSTVRSSPTNDPSAAPAAAPAMPMALNPAPAPAKAASTLAATNWPNSSENERSNDSSRSSGPPIGETAGKDFPVARAMETPAAPAIAAAAAPRFRSDSKSRDQLGDFEKTATIERRPSLQDEGRLRKAKEADTATYRPIIENPFTFVAQQPLSTFSLDVDTASYANVRRFLNSGQRPPPDAVRIEELVNYFPYHYEGPAADRPVAVHVDFAETPWQPLHRIARVAVKAREVKNGRSAANFVFLLDVSGSMEPKDRLPLIKQSLCLLVDQMREDDRVAIVTYAGESGVALESTAGTRKEKILQAIAKLEAGGSTNGASGIRLAYEQAALNFGKDRINRVILGTDGDFNVGTSSVPELEKLIAEKARSGVFLSVLGVGTDNLHDHTMQALADRGNGNYHYLDSVSEARKVLVEQMTGTLVTVAKDVKVQVEFNPAQVAAYRLIGYEKRMLAKEDFNNDQKDAGEIGAGHTVTALYEIVPASLKYPDGRPLVDELKYAQAPASRAESAAAAPAAKPAAAPATNETMTVKVRYKEPGEDTSKFFDLAATDAHKKLSENDRDFRFAVSVAGFGMLLRGSPNSEELTWEGVRRLALAGKGDDEQGWRGEFIQLIDKARGVSQER